jgi:hypothetical protein
MRTPSKVSTLFFIFICLLPACASTRFNPLLSQEPDSHPPAPELIELQKNNPKLWAKRNNRSSLAAFIYSNEKVAKSSLGTQSDFVLQARAYYILGEYFSNTNDERSAQWNEASNWAEKALTFNLKFKESLLVKKKPAELGLDTLTKKDVDALYWYAAALGRWATTQGISSELKYKDRVKQMIDRVAKLNPNYFYGAVYRYYGVYYALLPEFNEDDLKNSRKNFEKALKRSPEYFGNHVLFAHYYAKKMNDQTLFNRHLQIVIKGDPHQLKDVYPEQVLEQNRAKSLIAEESVTP